MPTKSDAMLLTPNDRLRTAPPLRKSRLSILADAALLAVIAIAILIHLGLLAGMAADVMSVFFRALAMSTVLSIVPLAVLWFLDRRERETPWLFAACFLWGGCIATALVLPFNMAFFQVVDRWVALNPVVTEILGPEATTLIAAPLSAPIAEELAKAAGVVLIFWLLHDEFDNMRDGFVYGALVGMGFNWFEAALYVAQGYVTDGVAPYELQLGVRYALFGLGGHAMFSGLFGLFLGLAVQTQRRWLKVIAPVTGLVLAVAAHMWNNVLPLFAALAAAAAGQPPGAQPGLEEAVAQAGFLEIFASASIFQLTIFLPFLLIAGVALWRSGVWERRVIREELASEVGYSVSAEEYRDILADRVLRTRRISDAHPALSAALVNAQHELAFRKRRVRDRGGEPEQDPLVAGWRRDIQHLRQMF
jgi:RsiW-degrading membrane proteinase PrsW (M82 family)